MKYFDYAATTPPSDLALEAYVEVSKKVYGNPGSDPRAHKFEEETRMSILKALKMDQECDLVFTSGGTEANNLAIIGTVKDHFPKGSHFMTTSFEHASVLEVFDKLDQGNFVTYLPINEYGYVDLKIFAKSLRPETRFVSVMHVNNELGTTQPVREMYDIIMDYNPNIEFMVDGVQGLGKAAQLDFIPDYLTISSHKIYGPKSVGAVIVKKERNINRLILGGTKEGGRRAGTQSLPAQYGFSKCVEYVVDNENKILDRVSAIRNYLEEKILQCDNLYLNARSDTNVISVFVDSDLTSRVIINKLYYLGFLISAKSADSNDRSVKSKTLKSIGLSDFRCDRTIRISISDSKTESDIDELVDAIKLIVINAKKSKLVRVTSINFDEHKKLRKQVFCDEQGFDPQIEIDKYDDLDLVDVEHYSLYLDDKIIGTCRILHKEDYIKFGRICISNEYRAQGYGQILVQKVMENYDSSVNNFYLEAQIHATRFYNHLGFKEYGLVFLEEGAEHIKMVRKKAGYNQFRLI